MFKRIDHVEIVPHDFERAISFYTAVLGFKVKNRQKVEVSPLEEVAVPRVGRHGIGTFAGHESFIRIRRFVACRIQDDGPGSR